MDINSTSGPFEQYPPFMDNTILYPQNTYYTPPRVKTTTTVREYDEEGRLVKETVTVTEPYSDGYYGWYSGGTQGYGQTIKTTETNG